MPEELFLSTDAIEPRLRNECWRTVTRPLFDTELWRDDGEVSLRGTLRMRVSGRLAVAHSEFNAQRFRRDRRVIREGALTDFYVVQLRQSGTADVDCAGNFIRTGPGDVTAFDLDRTWLSRGSAGSILSVIVPRAEIDKAAGGRSLHGTVLQAASPIAQLMSHFLASLSARPPASAYGDALAIEEAASAVLASAFTRRAAGELLDDTVVTAALRRRMLAFVDAHLADQYLGPELLLRTFQISRAHLYRMFAADGGVATMVRERRLEAAYRELAACGGTKRSITAIANDLAFSSSNQFLRAFRARFGMTPSEARHEDVQPVVHRRRFDVQTYLAHVRGQTARNDTPGSGSWSDRTSRG